jgi:hypothetical protein
MVQLTEIKRFVPDAIYAYLEQDNNFDDVASQALEIIRDETGIEIVDERPVELNWLVVPFAFIVEYLTSDKLGNPTPESIARLNDKYENAFKFLVNHKIKAVRDGSRSCVGRIAGLYGEEALDDA